jgi:hypothetical protein
VLLSAGDLQVKGEEDYYYNQQQEQGVKPFAKEVA